MVRAVAERLLDLLRRSFGAEERQGKDRGRGNDGEDADFVNQDERQRAHVHHQRGLQVRDDATGRGLIHNLLALAVRLHDVKQVFVLHPTEDRGRQQPLLVRFEDAVAERLDAVQHFILRGE